MDHDPIAPIQGRDQTLHAGRVRVVGESEGLQLHSAAPAWWGPGLQYDNREPVVRRFQLG